MKKIVVMVDLYDDRIKQKAMKAVSGLSGVDSVNVEMKDQKLTITGDIDPVNVVGKLRKLCHTEIVSVGPEKEPEKKPKELVLDPLKFFGNGPAYYISQPPYYYVRTVEEDPYNNSTCVIC